MIEPEKQINGLWAVWLSEYDCVSGFLSLEDAHLFIISVESGL